jgi:acetylornithine deacetylase/succinyl-diaminopimelate desuccinylase-like protein
MITDSLPRLRLLRLFAIVAGVAVVFISRIASAQYTPANAHERLARGVYSELVGINTMDTVGSTTRAARALAKRFLDAGFAPADVQILIPPGDSTKGNLIVRYHGTGGANSRKPLLLLAHLDVVAALRSDWSRDPFELQEDNQFFYGRGSADDKAMASIFVANLLTYKAENWHPSRDIILALTAAEEGGDNNGAEWLVQNHKDLIDAEYALNEGGGGALSGSGANVKPLFNSIQAAEKVPENFTITVRNSGGHSSVPRPDNAIYSLANALAKLSKFSFPVALNPVSKEFFAQTAKVEKPDMARAMRAIVANPNDASAAAILSANPEYNSMLRTTCVATRLFGGHANNALPQLATANVNCRIVPTSSIAETQATLTHLFADSSIAFSFTTREREKFPTSTAPIEPDLLRAATALTNTMWGNIPVVPLMQTGATDGRYLRAYGIPTYGISGIFSLPGENNAHGRDEKLRVKSFYEGLNFLDKLVRELAGPT